MDISGGIINTWEISTLNNNHGKVIQRFKINESPSGRKVVFLGKEGMDTQIKKAMELFSVGQILTVKEIYVDNYSSQVEFYEKDGKFNTVMFQDFVLDIFKMTKSDFEMVPKWDKNVFDKELENIDRLIIIPTSNKHEYSNWNLMEIVAVTGNNKPICKFTGCHDALRIDNYDNQYSNPNWTIECLPCGYLSISDMHKNIKIINALSDFNIAVKEEEK